MVRVKLAVFLLGMSAVVAGSTARAALVIGVFDASRATTGNILSGGFSHDAVATINIQFPGTTFVSFPTITPAALTGVDILMIASDKTDTDPITPLSAGEQSAMLNFVQGGGRALILADGWGNHVPAAQSMVGPFGLTIADDGHVGPQNGTPIGPVNPITGGSFGAVSQIKLYGAGIFTGLGPQATALGIEDVTGQPVLAAIEAHALSPTSGRVVLFTDSQMFIDNAVGGYFNEQKALFQNTMQYLAPVPEPSTLALAGMSLVGLLVGRWNWRPGSAKLSWRRASRYGR